MHLQPAPAEFLPQVPGKNHIGSAVVRVLTQEGVIFAAFHFFHLLQIRTPLQWSISCWMIWAV